MDVSLSWYLSVLVALGVLCCLSNSDPLTIDNLPHTNRLVNDLFRYYRNDVRPVGNASVALNVTVHLWFKQVLKVDEIDQVLTIYLWIEEYWKDEFLTWNPQKYGNVDTLHIPADRVWRPDLLFYNNADMNVHENELTTNVVIQHNGSVMCFRAAITKITCNLDMTYFPFDQQNCSMMIASWSADGSKVFVIPKEANNNLIHYIENTEWKLLNFSYEQHSKYYDCCPEPYPDITYYFQLERNPSYYVLNLIIPSVFITIVTMVGFFTPYSSSGENTEKVSLGVTALLSLAIILLSKYYIGLIWLIFAATIITTVTLRLQSKGNAGKPLSRSMQRLFFRILAPILCMKLDLPPKPRRTQTRDFSDLSQNSKFTRDESWVPLIHANGRAGTHLPCHDYELTIPPQTRRSTLIGERRHSDTAFEKLINTPDTDQHSTRTKRHCNADFCEETAYQSLLESLTSLSSMVENIDNHLQWRLDYEYIQHQWGQLARVVERLLMIAFILGTILFAALITVLAVPIPVVSFWD